VATASGTDQDLAAQYGKITEAELLTHVGVLNGTQTHLKQNSSQMVIYLKESLGQITSRIYMLAGVEAQEKCSYGR
jgi:hypothetical protein